MTRISTSIKKGSIFGEDPLVLTFWVSQETFSLDSVLQVLERRGAVIERQGVDHVDCFLPVARFIGRIGYRRTLNLPCSVEVRPASEGRLLVLVCALGPLRKANRFLLYGLCCFTAFISLGRLLSGRDASAFLFLLAVWPIVELNWFRHRLRLQGNLVDIISGVSGVSRK